MKKIILVLSLFLGVMSIMSFDQVSSKIETVKTTDSDYEEDWEDVKGQYAICPITPICPIPKTDCGEGYKCGYNRGFKAGMKAAKEDKN